jgi:hypothetical protein
MILLANGACHGKQHMTKIGRELIDTSRLRR